MQKTLPLVTSKSTLGKARTYTSNLWAMLVRYSERGDLPIDSNYERYKPLF